MNFSGHKSKWKNGNAKQPEATSNNFEIEPKLLAHSKRKPNWTDNKAKEQQNHIANAQSTRILKSAMDRKKMKKASRRKPVKKWKRIKNNEKKRSHHVHR